LRAVKKHIAGHRRLFFDNLPVVRLYYAEAGSASFSIRAGFDKDLRTLRDERAEKLISVFEKGVKENIFRELDPYHMGPALHGIIDAFLFRWWKILIDFEMRIICRMPRIFFSEAS
jgi:TetR/AcrR family transcriptional regulator